MMNNGVPSCGILLSTCFTAKLAAVLWPARKSPAPRPLDRPTPLGAGRSPSEGSRMRKLTMIAQSLSQPPQRMLALPEASARLRPMPTSRRQSSQGHKPQYPPQRSNALNAEFPKRPPGIPPSGQARRRREAEAQASDVPITAPWSRGYTFYFSHDMAAPKSSDEPS